MFTDFAHQHAATAHVINDCFGGHRVRRFGVAIADEIDAEKQSPTAHIANDLVPGLQFTKTLKYIPANVCGILDANSSEFDPESTQKIFLKLKELQGVDDMGANMRLGAFPCDLKAGSVAHRAYEVERIRERHRHRYEFNPEFLKPLSEKGLDITGLSPDGRFVEIVEVQDHPWFLACQFHPEFTSKPLQPHPLFRQFIAASYARRKQRTAAARHA